MRESSGDVLSFGFCIMMLGALITVVLCGIASIGCLIDQTINEDKIVEVHQMTLDKKDVVNDRGWIYYMLVFTDGTKAYTNTTYDSNNYVKCDVNKTYWVSLNKFNKIVKIE